MRKKIFFLSVVVFYLILSFLIENVVEVQAAEILKSPLGCGSLEDCANKVIDFIFYIAVVLAPLMIVIAGYFFITAAGSAEKVNQAKRIITWTVIGILIVMLSRAIVTLIEKVLGGS